MCWHNTFVEGVEMVCRDYAAPTFSWCSVNGMREIRRYLQYQNFTPEAVVVDFNIEMRHAGAPFGALVDGYIVLRGRLAPALLKYAGGEYRIVLDHKTQDHDGTTGREELKFYSDTHIQAIPAATSSPESHQEKVSWTGTRASKAPNGGHAARLGAPPESDGCVVWMLLVGTVIWSWDKVEVQCILVLGKSVRRPGAYEHLGLVSAQGGVEPHPKPMENRGWTETLTLV
jgi:hypothetical protein